MIIGDVCFQDKQILFTIIFVCVCVCVYFLYERGMTRVCATEYKGEERSMKRRQDCVHEIHARTHACTYRCTCACTYTHTRRETSREI